MIKLSDIAFPSHLSILLPVLIDGWIVINNISLILISIISFGFFEVRTSDFPKY